jgi:hypothetical protein
MHPLRDDDDIALLCTFLHPAAAGAPSLSAAAARPPHRTFLALWNESFHAQMMQHSPPPYPLEFAEKHIEAYRAVEETNRVPARYTAHGVQPELSTAEPASAAAGSTVSRRWPMLGDAFPSLFLRAVECAAKQLRFVSSHERHAVLSAAPHADPKRFFHLLASLRLAWPLRTAFVGLQWMRERIDARAAVALPDAVHACGGLDDTIVREQLEKLAFAPRPRQRQLAALVALRLFAIRDGRVKAASATAATATPAADVADPASGERIWLTLPSLAVAWDALLDDELCGGAAALPPEVSALVHGYTTASDTLAAFARRAIAEWQTYAPLPARTDFVQHTPEPPPADTEASFVLYELASRLARLAAPAI